MCRTIVEGHGPAVYFVISRGGVVCPRCRPEAPEAAVRLDPASVLALSRLGVIRLDEAASFEHGGAAGALALTRFFASILDRELRSAGFLDSIL